MTPVAMTSSLLRKPVSARTALICGMSGQDGSYLAAHLLDLGYRVVGTSRDAQASRFEGLERLGIREIGRAHV